MDEAAVCQRASSFRCVTDAPNDVINHDAAPFKGDLGVRGQGRETYRAERDRHMQSKYCPLYKRFPQKVKQSSFDCVNCDSRVKKGLIELNLRI